MNKLNLIVQIFLRAGLMSLVAACSDSNNLVDINENEIIRTTAKVTMNGAGYNNTEIKFTSGYSSFSAADNRTYIGIWGTYKRDSVCIAIQFEGTKAGVFNWNNKSGDLVVNRLNSDDVLLFIAESKGSNTIDSFGKVGEKIEGKISGRLYEVSSMEEMSVTGNFSVVRGPDSN